jgi:hypothetical protein
MSILKYDAWRPFSYKEPGCGDHVTRTRYSADDDLYVEEYDDGYDY